MLNQSLSKLSSMKPAHRRPNARATAHNEEHQHKENIFSSLIHDRLFLQVHRLCVLLHVHTPLTQSYTFTYSVRCSAFTDRRPSVARSQTGDVVLHVHRLSHVHRPATRLLHVHRLCMLLRVHRPATQCCTFTHSACSSP